MMKFPHCGHYGKLLISRNFLQYMEEIFANFCTHSVVMSKIYSPRKKMFRQINYLAIHLAKLLPLLSRNFCQKGVRVKFRYFHTVLLCVKHAQIYSHHLLVNIA